MQENRRGFLSHCALMAFLGMELSMPGEASANGIFSKPGSFCRAKILTQENASLGSRKWNRDTILLKGIIMISLAKSGTVNLD